MMLTDRVKISILCAVLSIFAFSCKTGRVHQDASQTFISDSDGIIIEEMTDTIIVYHTRKNRKLHVLKGSVCYEGGDEQLKQDIYNNLLMDYECNVREVFCVLFDEKLNIQEIRASNLGNIKNQREIYLDDYIKAIKKTKGKWRKCKAGEKWYLYVVTLHIH